MNVLAQFRSKSAAFREATDGAVALEFLLVLPILIMLYVGAFEGSRLYEVSRKTNTATETIGDLVGRTRSVTVNELDKMFDISRAIMAPFDPADLDVRITAVEFNASRNEWLVSWSRKDGAAGLAKGSSFKVPDELAKTNNTFFVFVDSAFSYASPMGYSVMPEEMEIEKQYAIVPRISSTIPCSDCG